VDLVVVCTIRAETTLMRGSSYPEIKVENRAKFTIFSVIRPVSTPAKNSATSLTEMPERTILMPCILDHCCSMRRDAKTGLFWGSCFMQIFYMTLDMM
jgi:hypothetical protein